MSKADYVRSQPQFRRHGCHWPGCEKQVPPSMWGCPPHWFKLPSYLRRMIWQHYRPGQEIDMKPSREYVEVAREVQEWIETNALQKTQASGGEGGLQDV